MNKLVIAGLCLGLVLPFLGGADFHPDRAAAALPKTAVEMLVRAHTSSPTIYYVSPTGADSNPGTSGQPWRTIQKSANTMVAGDTVLVSAGNYPERVLVTESGRAGAPITYQAQGTVAMHGFTVRASDVTIRGFEITTPSDDWTDGNGIFVEGSNCRIEDNYIYLAAHSGITLYATVDNPAVTSNCIVMNNRLYRSGDSGIDVRGRKNLVQGNEIWGGTSAGTPWPGDCDGIVFFGSGHIIHGNNIHNLHDGVSASAYTHTDCFQTWNDSPHHERASNIIFERNLCRNYYAQDANATGQGFMIEGGASDLTIRNNIIRAYRGVNVSGASSLTIVNNVFAGDVLSTTTHYPVGVTLVRSPGTTIKNNIFYDLPGTIIGIGDGASKQALDIGYNLAYRSDAKPLWGSPYPNDLWGVNPLFVNPPGDDFHLQAGSPAIDAGISLPSVTDDMEGTPRPQGARFDIGAYEPLMSRIFLPVVCGRFQLIIMVIATLLLWSCR